MTNIGDIIVKNKYDHTYFEGPDYNCWTNDREKAKRFTLKQANSLIDSLKILRIECSKIVY